MGSDSGVALIVVVLIPILVLALILVLIAAVTSAPLASATGCAIGVDIATSTRPSPESAVPGPSSTAGTQAGDASACVGGSTATGAAIPSGLKGGAAGAVAVRFALGELGKPYRWAAAGPDAYDCSGLTMRAWEHAGVQLPHSSRIQYRRAEKIAYAQLRPGDLLFYATDTANQDTIHHVSMYIGGGQMIEAPYTGANVRVTAVRRTESMLFAGRP